MKHCLGLIHCLIFGHFDGSTEEGEEAEHNIATGLAIMFLGMVFMALRPYAVTTVTSNKHNGKVFSIFKFLSLSLSLSLYLWWHHGIQCIRPR